MENAQPSISNPLSELLSDEVFELLYAEGVFNKNAVRDYVIRRKFKQLRTMKYTVETALELIQDEYKYLQFDTIRKIVYDIYMPKKDFFNS